MSHRALNKKKLSELLFIQGQPEGSNLCISVMLDICEMFIPNRICDFTPKSLINYMCYIYKNYEHKGCLGEQADNAPIISQIAIAIIKYGDTNYIRFDPFVMNDIRRIETDYIRFDPFVMNDIKKLYNEFNERKEVLSIIMKKYQRAIDDNPWTPPTDIIVAQPVNDNIAQNIEMAQYIDSFFMNIARKLGFDLTDPTDKYYNIFQTIFHKYYKISENDKYYNKRNRNIVDKVEIMVGDNPIIIQDIRIVVMYNLINLADISNDIFDNFRHLLIYSHHDNYSKGVLEINLYFKKYDNLLLRAMRLITHGLLVSEHMTSLPGYSNGMTAINYGFSDTFAESFKGVGGR